MAGSLAMSPPFPAPARTALPVPLLRAAVAVLVMAVALATAGLLTAWLGGGRSVVDRLLPAALVSVVVVPAILVLRLRWDRSRLSGIGLTDLRTSVNSLLLGAGVVSGCGAVIVAAVSLTGGISWTGFDPLEFMTFLAVNTAIALLLEALPEELSIRGYALTALRSRCSRGVAALLATAAFLALPPIALGLQALLSGLTGSAPLPSLAPAGEEPLTYYAMLAGFSMLLIFAREATVSASIWTCIGAHLAFLTVNRILLGAGATGVELEVAGPALAVTLPLYLCTAVVAFSLLRERADRRRAQ